MNQEDSTHGRARTQQRPWRGDAYWQYEMEGILLGFGAEDLPDLTFPNDDSGKKTLVASRVRLKYIVRRVRALKQEYVGPQLDERVHDILDQARLETNGLYWRELDHEFHTRGVLML